MYIIIDLKTGHEITRKRTLRSAEGALDAFLATWVWAEGQLGIELAK